MKRVRAKKYYGQHFLKDSDIASKIVDFISAKDVDQVVELGPGMGILSEFILDKNYKSSFVEIDKESIDYLKNRFPKIRSRIIHDDFLKVNVEETFKGNIALIGNFPYNISSQILFKMLDHKDKIPELVGMFQKEVANRVTAVPGNRIYGIISVFIQAYYNTEYLLTIGPEMFSPPPKVQSAVIRLTRNAVDKLNCDEKLFYRLVKQTFNQRRKMIRNTLKAFGNMEEFQSEFLTRRPEELSVDDFVKLCNELEKFLGKNNI